MSCIAVGNFDGVHNGHLNIVSTAAEIAKNKNVPCIVVTFSSNTKRALGKKVSYLTDNEYKEQLLIEAGADKVEFLEFSSEISSLNGKDFICLLKNKYGLIHIVCGDNFRFGFKASCGIDELKAICNEEGIGCTVVTTDAVSSTAIRNLLMEGKISEANMILGRDFSYKGDFISGNHIGRTIGYPTLNQAVSEDYILPPCGVYATYCFDGTDVYPAVTNIGKRPTVTDSDDIYVETYLIDLVEIPEDKIDFFKRIYFSERIRDEKKFEDIGKLRAQISRDCEYVRKLFAR
jgi:riboflavin kinase/FMN adenylyltransferase